ISTPQAGLAPTNGGERPADVLLSIIDVASSPDSSQLALHREDDIPVRFAQRLSDVWSALQVAVPDGIFMVSRRSTEINDIDKSSSPIPPQDHPCGGGAYPICRGYLH